MEAPKIDFPPAMTVQELYDYLAEHIAAGRGHYFPEVRCHYLIVPQSGFDHDDRLKVVILNGRY